MKCEFRSKQTIGTKIICVLTIIGDENANRRVAGWTDGECIEQHCASNVFNVQLLNGRSGCSETSCSTICRIVTFECFVLNVKMLFRHKFNLFSRLFLACRLNMAEFELTECKVEPDDDVQIEMHDPLEKDDYQSNSNNMSFVEVDPQLIIRGGIKAEPFTIAERKDGKYLFGIVFFF